VADGHVPALLDHIRDVLAGLTGGLVLILNGLVLPILDERVAANGHYRYSLLCHVRVLSDCDQSSRQARKVPVLDIRLYACPTNPPLSAP
jgi:hypothetical protein